MNLAAEGATEKDRESRIEGTVQIQKSRVRNTDRERETHESQRERKREERETARDSVTRIDRDRKMRVQEGKSPEREAEIECL